MFFSHGPVNAVSVGPEQEVLRQQGFAKTGEKRSSELVTMPSQISCTMAIVRK
jgi:hypothetical protein